MVKALFRNLTCWLNHISPDPATGLDPEGVHVQAAHGLGAADYLIAGYWLWSKLIANLADIGYREQHMELLCYDWRLDMQNLEARDRFLTRMKLRLEELTLLSGERVV